MKQQLNEVKQLQKIAGLIKEDQSDYYINVSVRDAKNALEILRDQFANEISPDEHGNRTIELDGSDSYVIKNKDIAIDLMDAFEEYGIEVIDTDVPTNDEDEEADSFYDDNYMEEN